VEGEFRVFEEEGSGRGGVDVAGGGERMLVE
jgi:hypothetical protein